MPTFKKFTGLNNVLPRERLSPSELFVASNVDVGLDGQVSRRKGTSSLNGAAHRDVWEGDGFRLVVRGNDLVNAADGTVLHAGIGTAHRVWYCNLPDGRTTYGNGVVNGVVTAAARTTFGVPLPGTVGSAADVAGSLFPGDYQYSLTYVRASDGLEGGPAYGAPVTIAAGGLSLTSLPTLAGHSINVYLTSHFGGQSYLAGNTAGSTFSFTGANKDLVLPCRTDFMYPAPLGTVCALWNGRVLLAVGPVLYASQHARYELFDLRRDFKQFSGDITAIVRVDDGIYVGTTKELAFLAGAAFDKLTYNQVVDAPVVLGSAVSVSGEHVKFGDAAGHGQAMICIADGMLTAGFSGGQISRLTEGRYVTSVTEVAATFRIVDGIPQYIACVQ